MRLPELIVLLCLLFSACIVSKSNAVARKTFLVSNLIEGAKKENTTSEVLHGAHKCNPKRHQLGHYLSCSEKKIITSDDKRVVPTGPNPLHNR